ncbi:MAG: hypothetical protein HY313_00835 [Acidobacteria bacterium]|nr:hypothetical protein [Acidobacteriota bacterium]
MKQNLRIRPAPIRVWEVAASIGIALLFAMLANAADQKLILKDGTDQLVRSYEIKGDRVRYFSAERLDWEEIPASFVDWEATEKAKQEAEEVPEVELETPPPPFEVAPGIPLPDKEGVYAYDGKNLAILEQSQTTVRNDRTRSILGSVIPGLKGRAWAELAGPSAKFAIANPNPVFYLQLDQPSAAGYTLVRLEPKDDRRVVGEILIAPVTGKMSESQQFVPSTSESVRDGSVAGELPVLRLTPQEPLRTGEYAVIEFVEKGRMNLFVWDFRVAAPAPTKP